LYHKITHTQKKHLLSIEAAAKKTKMVLDSSQVISQEILLDNPWAIDPWCGISM
jgi:hypothetical protein